MLGTDGTTNNGTIRTTIASSGYGDALRVRMTHADGSTPPDDDATCAELVEYATDQQKHWEAVKAAAQAIAAAIITVRRRERADS